jgi:hypothetical protein
VDVDHVEPARAQRLDLGADEGARLIGRVVEDLDLEPAAWPFDGRRVLEQPVGDRGLVVERQLQGHVRELTAVFEALGRERRNALFEVTQMALVPEHRQDQVAPMQAVHREGQEHGKICRA